MDFNIDGTSVRVIHANITDKISGSYQGLFLVHAEEVPDACLGKNAHWTAEYEGVSQYYYFKVISISRVSTADKTFLIECSSPLFIMQQQYRSRGYSNVTLRDLLLNLLTEDSVFNHSQIQLNMNNADQVLHYVEQHQCADFEFFQRLIRDQDLMYFFQTDNQDTFSLCVSNKGICQKVSGEHVWNAYGSQYAFIEHANEMLDVNVPMDYLTLATVQKTSEYIHPMEMTKHTENGNAVPFCHAWDQSSGMCFPFLEKTDVVVGRLANNPDQPVIMGALYNETYPNPFHAADRDHKMIRTQSGNGVMIHDHVTGSAMTLSTANQNHLLLDVSSGSLNMQTFQGSVAYDVFKSVDVSIRKAINWCADNSLIRAGTMHLISEKEKIKIISEDECKISSAKNMDVALKSVMNVNIKENMEIESEKGYSLSAANMLNISTQQGSIQLSGAGQAVLTAQKILVLQSDSSFIKITEHGEVTLQSQKVIFETMQLLCVNS